MLNELGSIIGFLGRLSCLPGNVSVECAKICSTIVNDNDLTFNEAREFSKFINEMNDKYLTEDKDQLINDKYLTKDKDRSNTIAALFIISVRLEIYIGEIEHKYNEK